MRGTYLALQSFKALLLRVRVDVCSDDEANDVEEGHPGVLGKELLRKGKRQRRHNPADLHNGKEASLDGRLDLVERTCASDNGHTGEVDGVLDGRDLASQHMPFQLRTGDSYNEVAGENLQDLGLQTRASGKDLLQDGDEEVAEWCANECAVQAHLGDSGVEVVAMLAAVVRDPRRKEFLEREEGSGREHLRAQRI